MTNISNNNVTFFIIVNKPSGNRADPGRSGAVFVIEAAAKLIPIGHNTMTDVVLLVLAAVDEGT
jgi:hypothetical protein